MVDYIIMGMPSAYDIMARRPLLSFQRVYSLYTPWDIVSGNDGSIGRTVGD